MDNKKSYLKLNDIDAYKVSFHLSNFVWEVVIKWSNFAQDTVGKQFVKAADSISANIAEGFGRYTKKDKIRFYRISMGSVQESFDWNEKSLTRNLISDDQYNEIFQNLEQLPKLLNQLIKYTNLALKE